ncbi:MAG TPA: HNH endonuclease signature motif containing protein [Blastocatellia bacterium]
MSPTKLPDSLRARVREAAGDRCGYCLSPQRLVMGKLEVEHIIPRALGGADEEFNLWLSCGLCNRYKGSQRLGIDPVNNSTSELFNPRTQVWTEHFRWSSDGAYIIGLTSVGRATVDALRLNNELAVEVRRNWVLSGWHPPGFVE